MSRTNTARIAAFKASKLTSAVFKIVEYDDIYSEHPFIYAKILPQVIVLVDSGCGGASNNPTVDVTNLREFLETWPVDENNGKPFNENGSREYIVVCTHCHYDHIREFCISNPARIVANVGFSRTGAILRGLAHPRLLALPVFSLSRESPPKHAV